MKKNVKNKILAFSMASAMIVPNVAVVFAEAPKAGLATVAKETTDVATYPVKLTIVTDTGDRTPLEGLKLPAGQQTYDISGMLNIGGWELDRSVKYYADFNYDATKFPINVSTEYTTEVEVFVTAKKAEVKTYNYKINLIDYETNQKLADGDLTFNAAGDQTYDITPVLNHYGVELADIDSYKGIDAANFPFHVNEDGVANTWDIYVSTKKEEVKTYSYKINLIDNETNQKLADGDLVFNAAGDQTYDITPILNHYGVELANIDGYKGVDAANFPFHVNEDGVANVRDIYVSAKKEEVKTYSYKINLIDNETNQKLADGELVFNAAGDQTYDITPVLKHYGVKLADLDAYKGVDAASFPFTVNEDGVANVKDIFVTADTQYTTTLSVTFITSDDTVVGEKTFEKTTDNDDDVVFGLGTDITLPEGYHWVDHNDQVKDVTLPAGATGGHYMYVEQDETKTVLNVTFETKDGEVVGTTSAAKDFTVDEEGVKVATFVVGEDFALPEGYHFAEDVGQDNKITVNGLVGGHTVIVEKDEVAPTPTEDPKKDDTKKEDPKKDDTKKEETKKASKTADTADTSDVAAYAIPLVMSMVAISAIVIGKKKLS